MSTKLSAEQLAEIPKAHEGAMRCACYEYDCGCPAMLLDHITALEEENQLCARAFELDEAFKIPEVGNLNALQVVKTLKALEEELNLAIAHDRQPYPTAEAYEKVCEALNRTKEELKAAQELGSMLQETLETRAQRELEMLAEVERESVNAFRSALVEAVRDKEQYFERESSHALYEARRQRASGRSWMAAEIVQLIQTFELEK